MRFVSLSRCRSAGRPEHPKYGLAICGRFTRQNVSFLRVDDVYSGIQVNSWSKLMETGAKQHLVPRQMIRRFANRRNGLKALHKGTLTVLKRPLGPKGILWKENYYKDGAGDLDAEWLTPIEQRFARYYPKLADAPWSTAVAPTEEGEAYVDWTISQLCRTQLLSKATETLAKNKDPVMRLAYALRPTLFHNEIRRGLFERLKEVYTQPLWKWKCFIISGDADFILTDQRKHREVSLIAL